MSIQERKIQYVSTGGLAIHPELEWERWSGNPGTRTTELGKKSLSLKEYFASELEKQREELRSGYGARETAQEQRRTESRRDALDSRQRADQIAEMGRRSFHLRRVAKALPATLQKKLKDLNPNGKRWLVDQDDEFRGERSEYDSEQEISSESDDEDWDTTTWSKAEIESAVETLVKQIREAEKIKKRRVASVLLTRLLKKHKMAVDHLDLIIPSLAEKALFVNNPGSKRAADSTSLTHLIVAVVPFLPEKLSRYACAQKTTRILSRKFALAARILQCKWRSIIFERKKAREVDVMTRARTRSTFSFALSDMLNQWRKFTKLGIGQLSTAENIAMLSILDTFCCKKANPYLSIKDCRIVVEHGGLLPLQHFCFSPIQRLRTLAAHILEKLARVPSLRPSLIHCGVQTTLSTLLQSNFAEDRCIGLEALDSLLRVVCVAKEGVQVQVWELMRNKFGKTEEEMKYHQYDASEISPQLNDTEKRFDLDSYLASPFHFVQEENAPTQIWQLSRAVENFESIVLAIIDRRRDGGLLRWLKALLHEKDGAMRIGALMCLIKLASSPCNPFLASVWESMTILEKKEERSYRFLRKDRGFQIVQSIILNVADLDIPEVSLLSIQLFCQLSLARCTRESLIEDYSVCELINCNLLSQDSPTLLSFKTAKPLYGESLSVSDLENRFRLRGLLLLVFLASKEEHPLSISELLREKNDIDDDLLTEERDRSTPIKLPPIRDSNSEGAFLDVLMLPMNAGEKEINRCFQSCMISMLTQDIIENSVSSVEQFLYTFGGLEPLLQYFIQGADEAAKLLFSRSGEEISDNEAQSNKVFLLEHLCVMGLVMGKICDLMPSIGSTLCQESIVNSLATVIRVCQDMIENIPQTISGLIEAGTASACSALCCISRANVECCLLVCDVLERSKSIERLVLLVSKATTKHSVGALRVHVAIQAAQLIGCLVPYQGIEVEAVTDNVVTTESRQSDAIEEREAWERFIAANPSLEERQQYLLEKRASLNAKRAAEIGIVSSVEEDIASNLDTEKEIEITKMVVELAGSRLTGALHRCRTPDLDDLRNTLCLTIARLCSTVRFATRFLDFGIVPVIYSLFRSCGLSDPTGNDESFLNKVDDHPNLSSPRAGEGEDIFLGIGMSDERGRACRIPPVLFTLCANVARSLEGKYAMISGGAMNFALEAVSDSSPTKTSERQKGEACALLMRLINMTHRIQGSVNDKLLARNDVLQGMMRLLRGRKSGTPFRARLHAGICFGQLVQDKFKSIPKLVRIGGIRYFAKLLGELEGKANLAGTSDESTENEIELFAITRQVLRVIQGFGLYMIGELHEEMMAQGLDPILRRIAQIKLPKSSDGSRSETVASKLPSILDMSRSIVDELRMTAEFGLDAKRQIATAPNKDTPERLQSGVISEHPPRVAGTPSEADLFLVDPFGSRGASRQHLRYSPEKGGLVRVPVPLTSSSGLTVEESKAELQIKNSRERRSRVRKKRNESTRSPRGNEVWPPMPLMNSLFEEGFPREISFSHCVPEKEPNLLLTRPKGRRTVSVDEMEEMEHTFLLSTRPSAKKPE